MITKPLCIIPARGGSKRFPRKNLALLQGKPLLAYAIEAARESEIFDLVCVSSEDQEILETAVWYQAGLALARPPALASDNAQVRQVCTHVLEYFISKGHFYREFAVLLVTNPLRTSQDLRSAYEIFRSRQANYLMSLVPFAHPPQRAVWAPQGYVEPYFGLNQMKQTQRLDQLYRHDGSFIFAKSQIFLAEGEFYGSKVIPYFMEAERSVDIDNPLDLAWAEFLLSRSSPREDLKSL
ncbi:acylneuraminate cytidylyltransferase family protein [Desulfobacca acetoxidans]|uniref:N-acylneuraminate cytidylyltransferase n=1 Tax=Desulfobacca acetoxidans (strain ATCC 700848 / DSM 11109 / ASRB2) TaxID=880072 RepID=F2NJR3_DESAR|nr:acylneuraminate cytidylyltransferase family protein [Desulfobacca acetoxidans]AEB09718.1 N-acylneuraminate cytidylyltransferase [Desulfobacca acetoxidans DSM 11109]